MSHSPTSPAPHCLTAAGAFRRMNTLPARSVEQEKHSRAFAFVCPGEHARRLAEVGYITESDAARHSWRDPICELVLTADLEAQGLTIADVESAIRFYTATEPTVTAEQIGSTPFVNFLNGQPGFLVVAAGYRAGPAGP